jgi:hypothetical protein
MIEKSVVLIFEKLNRGDLSEVHREFIFAEFIFAVE